MGKSAPRAPDPAAQAAAQTQSNRETAITQQQLNQQNVVTPWGNVTYSRTGQELIPGTNDYTPTYTQTTTLSPSQQAIFDQSQAAQGNLAGIAADQSAFLQDYLGQQIDTSGAPALQSGFGQNFNEQFSGNLGPNFNQQFNGDLGLQTSYAPEDGFSADRQRVEDALWQRTAGDRSSADAQMRSTLQAKGIREGSAAWNQEMQRMAAQNTDARLATLLAGGQEQSRLLGEARAAGQFGNQALMAQGQFGLGAQQAQNQAAMQQAGFGQQAQQLQNQAAAQQAGFGNQARQQYMQEAYQRRNQPLNEISALLSGTQVQNPAGMGAATPQTSVGGVDVAGLQQQAYQNNMAQYQNQMGGLGSLLGTGASLFFSDRRLKKNVNRVGATAGGTPVYSYQYIWGGPFHVGVMADEVPHAVVKHSSGFDMVDYARVS